MRLALTFVLTCLACTIAIAAVGCGDDDAAPPDAGSSPPDAGLPDAGAPDAGAPDAAPPACDTDRRCGPTCQNCMIAGLVCLAATECVDPQCHDRDDYTPCTFSPGDSSPIPDTSFDICIDERCLQPGYGTTGNVRGPTFPLPDTNVRVCVGVGTAGVTACADTAGAATCGAAPLCGQDAQYGADVGATQDGRRVRSEPTTGEPVVLDTLTGLMWQGCPAGTSGAACAGTAMSVEWADAVRYCESLTWGGFSDWRLPDNFALFSVVDLATLVPYLDAAAFPVSPPVLWTNTISPAEGSAGYGSMIFVWRGTNFEDVDWTERHEILCMRSPTPPPPYPSPRFVRSEMVAGQAVMHDQATGLDWRLCPIGGSEEPDSPDCTGVMNLDWQQALAACEDLDWGGHADWYLPNVLELYSVSTTAGTPPMLARTGGIDHYWSSTFAARDPMYTSWDVQLQGSEIRGGSRSNRIAVRCARRE